MTREEFYDDYGSWSALLSFCNEYGLDSCEDIYSAESVVDDLIEILRYESAYEAMGRVYDILEGMDLSCDYFDLSDNYRGLDDEGDLDDFMDRVAEEYDDSIGFEEYYQEDDEDDEYCEPTYDAESDPWHYDDSVVDESVDITVFSEIITCQ